MISNHRGMICLTKMDELEDEKQAPLGPQHGDIDHLIDGPIREPVTYV